MRVLGMRQLIGHVVDSRTRKNKVAETAPSREPASGTRTRPQTHRSQAAHGIGACESAVCEASRATRGAGTSESEGTGAGSGHWQQTAASASIAALKRRLQNARKA